jgi:hypothetical protein
MPIMPVYCNGYVCACSIVLPVCVLMVSSAVSVCDGKPGADARMQHCLGVRASVCVCIISPCVLAASSRMSVLMALSDVNG